MIRKPFLLKHLTAPGRVTVLAASVLLITGLTTSCSSQLDEWREFADETGLSGIAEDYARERLEERLEPYGGIEGIRSIDNVREALAILSIVIEEIWGDDNEEVPSEKRYVKYSNDYEARAIVDFEQGYLRVETIAEDAPLDKLERALVVALLTPRNLSMEDIFSDAEPELGEEPFLFEQVLDHDGEAIRYEWRAQRYAQHLLRNQLEQYESDGRQFTAVQTELVPNHLHLRQLQFSDYVLRHAQHYEIDPSLVYAVIEIESSFNPYAVSHANALGLMQIVQATAGRDVYERIKNLPGHPTRDELFVPDFNIDIGTAYLHLLDDLYLNRIRNEKSRRYAKIAAYNGGAGNVFRTFASSNQAAIDRINQMTPQQVYNQLVRSHPFGETRQYLEKVTVAEQKYIVTP